MAKARSALAGRGRGAPVRSAIDDMGGAAWYDSRRKHPPRRPGLSTGVATRL